MLSKVLVTTPLMAATTLRLGNNTSIEDTDSQLATVRWL